MDSKGKTWNCNKNKSDRFIGESMSISWKNRILDCVSYVSVALRCLMVLAPGSWHHKIAHLLHQQSHRKAFIDLIIKFVALRFRMYTDSTWVNFYVKESWIFRSRGRRRLSCISPECQMESSLFLCKVISLWEINLIFIWSAACSCWIAQETISKFPFPPFQIFTFSDFQIFRFSDFQILYSLVTDSDLLNSDPGKTSVIHIVRCFKNIQNPKISSTSAFCLVPCAFCILHSAFCILHSLFSSTMNCGFDP
jgi:hypothetical protein